MADRKYALTKIAPGDYLLPDNDGETLWRVSRYTDGPSMGLEIPRDRDFWGVWKWRDKIGVGSYFDFEDWTRWEQWGDSSYETRSEAIAGALSHG